MSKFSPIEFFESAKFYKGDSSPINAAKKVQGISYAWQHHKGRNPHHYEYWLDNFDKDLGGIVARKMPLKYVLELVCDYLSAGCTYNPKGFTYKGELEWWNKNKDNRMIHPETKELITAIFELIAESQMTSEIFTLKSKIKHVLLEQKFKGY